MCQFTLRVYLCGHQKFVTTPERTLLCDSALQFGLCQGIDRAPASCFPLPEDIHNHERIAQHQWRFTACKECWLESRYGPNDTKAVEDIETRIIELCEISNDALRAFQRRVDLKRKVQDLPHAWLRDQFTGMDGEKSVFSAQRFFKNLHQAGSWIQYLFTCLDQNNPRDMFDSAFAFVKEKVDAADKELRLFIKIIEHMDLSDWDDSAWQRKLCNLAGELKFLIKSQRQELSGQAGLGHATI